MRAIKFRGKRIDNNEWVYGFYGFKEESNKHFIMVETINLNSASYFTDYEVFPETVGQYTGLVDVNGKEIYEGDFVKWSDWEKVEQVTPLEWDVAMCRFVCRYKNGYWRMFGSEFSVEVVEGGEGS